MTLERNDKTIFISIMILFIVMTMLNGYIYLRHFSQVDEGVEAWVENTPIINYPENNTTEDNQGEKEIILNFTIMNLYDHHVQYIYSIYSHANNKTTYEIYNSILLSSNYKQTIHERFNVSISVKSLKIEITNGEYDINLIIKQI